MSMLTLNNDCLASVTAVPDLFLDQYMPAANGEFVKVYLYLLKLVKDHQQDSTLSSMADFFSCTENDIVRALKYWEKQGLAELFVDFSLSDRVEGCGRLVEDDERGILVEGAGDGGRWASPPERSTPEPLLL